MTDLTTLSIAEAGRRMALGDGGDQIQTVERTGQAIIGQHQAVSQASGNTRQRVVQILQRRLSGEVKGKRREY